MREAYQSMIGRRIITSSFHLNSNFRKSRLQTSLKVFNDFVIQLSLPVVVQETLGTVNIVERGKYSNRSINGHWVDTDFASTGEE